MPAVPNSQTGSPHFIPDWYTEAIAPPPPTITQGESVILVCVCFSVFFALKHLPSFLVHTLYLCPSGPYGSGVQGGVPVGMPGPSSVTQGMVCTCTYVVDSQPIIFADHSTQTLSVTDLDEVYSETVDASSEWFDLGLALKIQHPILTNLWERLHSSEKCLREMLAHRLKLTPPLTWGHLCECLRKNTVNRHDVAKAITRKHTGTTL